MCRFTAYIGSKPLIIKSVISDPEHSLICQSHSAKEMASQINADGFGFGWYNHKIDSKPAIYKSILPAWNDENLKNITSKIESDCFIGHVRAATYGNVNFANCHPFSFNNLLFAHNGSIRNFDQLKKPLITRLSPHILKNIKGQTDSEYFFALLCEVLGENLEDPTINQILQALTESIIITNELHKEMNTAKHSTFNLYVSNGKCMIITRYSSDPSKQPPSLYYTEDAEHPGRSILVSSEMLVYEDKEKKWLEVPVNHALIACSSSKAHCQKLNIAF